MNSIVIGKDSLAYAAKIGGGVIASFSETNLLADGAVAVFTSRSELVTAANVTTILADRKGVFIAVGSGDATKGAYVTTTIKRFGADYKKRAYQAPQKELKFVGYDGAVGALNFPTLIAGAEAFIKLIDVSKGLRTIESVYENEIKSYSYVLKTGDTDTLIINNLVTQINNDLTSFVVAAVVGTTPNLGISLTPKNYGVTIAIALDGILMNATKEEKGVSNSLPLIYGEGTDAQVLAMEDLFSPVRGNTNRVYQPQFWYSVPSMVVTGKTYDMYNIKWVGELNRQSGSQFTTQQQIVVALPVGVTAQTTFETIMARIFGNEMEFETGL